MLFLQRQNFAFLDVQEDFQESFYEISVTALISLLRGMLRFLQK